jgi:hypothetical protein
VKDRGGERGHISAMVSRSRIVMGLPHLGQGQVEAEANLIV